MRSLIFEPYSLVRNASCSPLLKLPLEIRNKIWASLLGDRLIHFEYVDRDSASASPDGCSRSWHSTVCQYDCPENEVTQDDLAQKHAHSRCAIHLERSRGDNPHIDYGCRLKREQSLYEEMHLTALRVCRQIYNEADRVLWSTNTFSFHDEATFRHFMGTRTACQKRLLRKLRLQINCVANEEAAWSRVLGITLIRSLVGLRSLRLQMNHTMDTETYQWIKALGLGKMMQMRLGFVQKMKVLPLSEVEVFVCDDSGGWPRKGEVMWAAEDRAEYADAIRRLLLDPKGVEKYAQDQEELKESHRQERERKRENQALRAAMQQNLIEFDKVWLQSFNL